MQPTALAIMDSKGGSMDCLSVGLFSNLNVNCCRKKSRFALFDEALVCGLMTETIVRGEKDCWWCVVVVMFSSNSTAFLGGV